MSEVKRQSKKKCMSVKKYNLHDVNYDRKNIVQNIHINVLMTRVLILCSKSTRMYYFYIKHNFLWKDRKITWVQNNLFGTVGDEYHHYIYLIKILKACGGHFTSFYLMVGLHCVSPNFCIRFWIELVHMSKLFASARWRFFV